RTSGSSWLASRAKRCAGVDESRAASMPRSSSGVSNSTSASDLWFLANWPPVGTPARRPEKFGEGRRCCKIICGFTCIVHRKDHRLQLSWVSEGTQIPRDYLYFAAIRGPYAYYARLE